MMALGNIFQTLLNKWRKFLNLKSKSKKYEVIVFNGAEKLKDEELNITILEKVRITFKDYKVGECLQEVK